MRDSKESRDRVHPFTPEAERVEAVLPVCRTCGEYLDLHQPDCELPDRLLGTCGNCKTWYLLNDDQESVEIAASILCPDTSLAGPLRGRIQSTLN
jgi:hypothetical protein